MQHEFTKDIFQVLEKLFSKDYQSIFELSPILQYLNIKTRSANRGSKSRGSFANLYAVFVLVEDYCNNGFDKNAKYRDYEGAKYTNLLTRQRELPFGNKLQNHGLNHRMNEEFKKYFPQCEFVPIMRDVATNRYWFNENLLKVSIGKKCFNIASAILKVIELYIETKKSAFDSFILTCEKLKNISGQSVGEVKAFIVSLLAPTVDARIFEIVSYAILKFYYIDQKVFFGFSMDEIEEENLKLYKTGRTNANDGGIDFVMKPLGRFFQVTETLDVKKYFLDIDKIERFPISFVIKSEESIDVLRENLVSGAEKQYCVKAIVSKYMDCIEEVINIPCLKERFEKTIKIGYLSFVLDEIIKQSKVEFNYQEEE